MEHVQPIAVMTIENVETVETVGNIESVGNIETVECWDY
jgi:hypothetical protein